MPSSREFSTPAVLGPKDPTHNPSCISAANALRDFLPIPPSSCLTPPPIVDKSHFLCRVIPRAFFPSGKSVPQTPSVPTHPSKCCKHLSLHMIITHMAQNSPMTSYWLPPRRNLESANMPATRLSLPCPPYPAEVISPNFPLVPLSVSFSPFLHHCSC